jgi:hypothetical protein
MVVCELIKSLDNSGNTVSVLNNIIYFIWKNYHEERISVLSSLETSTSPASSSSCREKHIVCKLNLSFGLFHCCELPVKKIKLDNNEKLERKRTYDQVKRKRKFQTSWQKNRNWLVHNSEIDRILFFFVFVQWSLPNTILIRDINMFSTYVPI